MKLDLTLTEKILTTFVKEETEKIGLRNVVLGLSGGIDSALSAAIAVEALGRDRVFAYGLPYKLSSKESMEDAYLVADHLGINFEVVDITPYAEPFMDSDEDMSKLRIGNVLARMRMVTIFDRSAKHSGIVLGTSNKTELLLGYGTWYGDLASAINPIGDLYKTQVWELSHHLGIPEKVVHKKPTADLWPDQTDEGELGFTYKDVDNLLYEMVDNRRRMKELLKMGFEETFITTIKEKIRKNQFKRKIPVIAKVSQRTIGRDFRYSRDWGC
jgi:NAD+ synthase